MTNSVSWTEDKGKYCLTVVFKGKKYFLYFEKDSRYLDGMVLFNDAEQPNMLNGMMAWSEFEKVLADKDALFANREIERFQSSVVLASGGTLDWTTPEEAYDVPPLSA